MQFHVATMIGRAALRLVDRLGSIGLLLYQVASCMWSGQFRMRVLVEQIAKIGVQSQPARSPARCWKPRHYSSFKR